MGFVDRGGGREAKGASLRRSKKNPGAPASRNHTALKRHTTPALRVPSAAPACLTQRLQHVDASVAILSRKLEADRAQLMPRAAQESGVAVALTWCADLERQEALVELCRQQSGGGGSGAAASSGLLYCLVGVHVNNVERTHKKVQEGWVESVLDWGRHPEVLGVLTGIHLDRDAGTHFAQEWLMAQLWGAAGTLQVPLVVHIHHKDGSERDSHSVSSSARAAELLAELLDRTEAEGTKKPTAVVLHNGIGAMAESAALCALVKRFAPREKASEVATSKNDENDNNTSEEGAKGVSGPFIYVLATAEGLSQVKDSSVAGDVDKNKEGNESAATALNPLYVKTLRAHVDLSQLLIGTGAPWYTPQNIPDAHLCTLPNEPANYRYVAEAIREVLVADADPNEAIKLEELMDVARDNFVRIFFSATSPSPAPELHEAVAKESSSSGATAMRTVHMDPTVLSHTGAIPAVAPDAGGHFLCLKCRRRLFPAQSLLTHLPDAAQAQFSPKHAKPNKARPATCDSMCFIHIADGSGSAYHCAEGLIVQSSTGTVSCAGCGAKLGTAGVDAMCPCSCVMTGRTARLAASKVEAPVRRHGGDLDELLAQAAREREEMMREVGESDGEGDNGGKRRKEPKKNVKANNRSNFTHFRNKNFAPRAIQGQGKESDGEDDEDQNDEVQQQQQTGGRKKNKRRNAKRMGGAPHGDSNSEDD